MPGARRSASLPFNIENAAPKQNNEADGYSDETFRILSEMMLKDLTLTAVNAATPAVLGLRSARILVPDSWSGGQPAGKRMSNGVLKKLRSAWRVAASPGCAPVIASMRRGV